VMHLAGFAGQTLYSKGYIDNKDAIQELRLAGLLHDVGHGPFSHLFEEVLHTRTSTTHEEMGKIIITKSELSDILSESGFSPEKVCRLSFGQSKTKYMNEIVAGGLSADIMDYLPRDGYFTGAEYGKIDHNRLISSFEVASNGRLAINRSSLNSLESMLISRYQMFKAVYFHKTVRSAEVMMLHAMILADEPLGLTSSSLEGYLKLTDEVTLDRICSFEEKNSRGNAKAVTLAIDYSNRKLLKCVFEKFLHKRNRLYKRMDARSLKKIEAEIASGAGVSRNAVFVDASRAPSMPLTPTKGEMHSLMIVEKGSIYEKPVSEIPLMDTISGFFDMLRVYTTAENREAVKRSVKKVLGSEGVM
jgi:uncharacterized protein